MRECVACLYSYKQLQFNPTNPHYNICFPYYVQVQSEQEGLEAQLATRRRQAAALKDGLAAVVGTVGQVHFFVPRSLPGVALLSLRGVILAGRCLCNARDT